MGKVGNGSTSINPPEPLHAKHDTSAFNSRESNLNHWLKRQALKNQKSGAARTYVVTTQRQVIGYYALCVGSVLRHAAPGTVRRNMPDPVPVMLLARLAIDQSWQGQGLGRGLLKDAVLRTLQAAELAGIRAMLVHAISEEAKRFYQYFGFRPSPVEDLTLMATLDQLRDAI